MEPLGTTNAGAAAQHNSSNASAVASTRSVEEVGAHAEAPRLPPFWDAEDDVSHSDGDENAPGFWKLLNSLSPSIQRDQCLWAYFDVPARLLPQRVDGKASIFARTDGFRSYLHVSCTKLNM